MKDFDMQHEINHEINKQINFLLKKVLVTKCQDVIIELSSTAESFLRR